MIVFQLTIVVACAAVVLVRALCLVANMTKHRRQWPRLRFLGFTICVCGLGVSAVAVVIGHQQADLMLLSSAAGMILFDRRTPR